MRIRFKVFWSGPVPYFKKSMVGSVTGLNIQIKNPWRIKLKRTFLSKSLTKVIEKKKWVLFFEGRIRFIFQRSDWGIQILLEGRIRIRILFRVGSGSGFFSGSDPDGVQPDPQPRYGWSYVNCLTLPKDWYYYYLLTVIRHAFLIRGVHGRGE